jgi:Holliday junction resolvase
MVRSYLYQAGAVMVMKAGGSKLIFPKGWKGIKPKVDLIALMPLYSNPRPRPVLVQVKKNSRTKMQKDELRELRRFSRKYLIPAYLAWREKGKIKMVHVEQI